MKTQSASQSQNEPGVAPQGGDVPNVGGGGEGVAKAALAIAAAVPAPAAQVAPTVAELTEKQKLLSDQEKALLAEKAQVDAQLAQAHAAEIEQAHQELVNKLNVLPGQFGVNSIAEFLALVRNTVGDGMKAHNAGVRRKAVARVIPARIKVVAAKGKSSPKLASGRPNNGRRITEQERAGMLAMKKRGETIAAMTVKYHCSRQSVTNGLKKAVLEAKQKAA